jgi:hypothetical protein
VACKATCGRVFDGFGHVRIGAFDGLVTKENPESLHRSNETMELAKEVMLGLRGTDRELLRRFYILEHHAEGHARRASAGDPRRAGSEAGGSAKNSGGFVAGRLRDERRGPVCGQPRHPMKGIALEVGFAGIPWPIASGHSTRRRIHAKWAMLVNTRSWWNTEIVGR